MGLLGVVGPFSIFVVLIVLALLSKRLGSVTRTRPYYLGFYLAAALIAISILARLMDEAPVGEGGVTSVLIYVGLPALSVTIGVVVAWRYWSWLFAERS
jgi:NADH:ubiquinone oxidoreductase subunit 6 (subunit J)